uniref:Uncharacterized protein n=1 Tax=Chondromyces catenulatus TaxID=1653841 RepID=A0A3S7UZC9_9BACT|nr:hypothetical protein [Chondromyces catenulatus]
MLSLSHETMGAIALAILWVNTLLIVAAAYKELAALGAFATRLRLLTPGEVGPGLVEGRVTRGAGEGGAIAALRVEQVGRLMRGSAPVIAFDDRPSVSEVRGGAVTTAEGAVEIEAAAGARVEVWIARERLIGAAACVSVDAFDAAMTEARKARGHVRSVVATLDEGGMVYVFGALRRNGGTRVLGPAEDGTLLVSAIDPRAFCAQNQARCALFILLALASAAGCTALALSEPRFGLLSTLGGALGLAFFLLIQPAGTMLRDAVRTPARAALRGRWTRPHDRDAGAEDASNRSVAASGSVFIGN